MKTLTIGEIRNGARENYQVQSNTARGFVNLPREWVEVGDEIIIDGEHLRVIEDGANPSEMFRPSPYDPKAREHKINEIIAYFEDNPEVFNSALEELDDYNGELGDERVYPMWELCDHFGNLTLREFLNKTRDNFDLGAGYFKYTYDGNVESCEEPDYSNHYYSMGYAVEELHDNRAHIMGTLEDNPELLDLFDELDEIDNGEIDE